jgi:hypothetical protein
VGGSVVDWNPENGHLAAAVKLAPAEALVLALAKAPNFTS